MAKADLKKKVVLDIPTTEEEKKKDMDLVAEALMAM